MFCDQLRERRRAKGLTLTELSNRVGYHSSYLSMVERGRRELDETGVVRIAQALEMDPAAALIAALRQRLPPELRHFAPESTDTQGSPLTAQSLRDPLTAHAIARELQAQHFEFEVDQLQFEATVDWDGNFRWIRVYEGCRPNADGRPVSQILFRERVLGATTDGEPNHPKFSVRRQPDGLEYELNSRKSNEWITHSLLFPGGWRRAARKADDEFSFAVEGYIPQGFTLDPSRLALRTQQSTVHVSPMGTLTMHLTNFARETSISFSFPDGYQPERWQEWVWWGIRPLSSDPRNLAGKATCRSMDFRTSGPNARLVVQQPLAGYTYAIAWTPADRQTYLEARYAISKD